MLNDGLRLRWRGGGQKGESCERVKDYLNVCERREREREREREKIEKKDKELLGERV